MVLTPASLYDVEGESGIPNRQVNGLEFTRRSPRVIKKITQEMWTKKLFKHVKIKGQSRVVVLTPTIL